jgi:hypothetical protein
MAKSLGQELRTLGHGVGGRVDTVEDDKTCQFLLVLSPQSEPSVPRAFHLLPILSIVILQAVSGLVKVAQRTGDVERPHGLGYSFLLAIFSSFVLHDLLGAGEHTNLRRELPSEKRHCDVCWRGNGLVDDCGEGWAVMVELRSAQRTAMLGTGARPSTPKQQPRDIPPQSRP